ncbi:MAG: hypothetical protein V4496_01745 [Pseudomonadota bacterium]
MMSLGEQTQVGYIVAKADRDAKGFGDDKIKKEQNAYWIKAMSASGVKVTEDDKGNKPLIILALLYSLSNMHDDTYIDLFGVTQPGFSRSELIEEYIAQLVICRSVSAPILYGCIAELVKFEGQRFAAKHAKADAHVMKNFRFIIDLDVLLRNEQLNKFFPKKEASLITMASGKDYWDVFLQNLLSAEITPAALMTKILIEFTRQHHDNKTFLNAWNSALENYCRDLNGLVPETNKNYMRQEIKKIQESGLQTQVDVPLTKGNLYLHATLEKKQVSGSAVCASTPVQG